MNDDPQFCRPVDSEPLIAETGGRHHSRLKKLFSMFGDKIVKVLEVGDSKVLIIGDGVPMDQIVRILEENGISAVAERLDQHDDDIAALQVLELRRRPVIDPLILIEEEDLGNNFHANMANRKNGRKNRRRLR